MLSRAAPESVGEIMKPFGNKLATNCNIKLFGKPLRSGYTAVDRGFMQGLLVKEHLRGVRCSVGPLGQPPRPRLPTVSVRLRSATPRVRTLWARRLLQTSTGRRRDTLLGQTIVEQLEVRRSIARFIRVNSVATTTLCRESCGKFLIELPPPVNIGCARHIMSRNRDIPVQNCCHF